MNILKRRKDKVFYSSLVGRYLMDIEMKFREFFAVWREFFAVRRDVFHFILNEINADKTKLKYEIKHGNK